MTLKLTLDHPSYPAGKVLSLKGLPPLENKRTVTVSDETAAYFKTTTGKTLEEEFAGSEIVSIQKTK